MVNRILILFAHPALQRSRVNRVLARGLPEMDGITFRDLYEEYPELDIDVAREQALLVEHDIIVFQHPFFWYSTPAILKEWQDLVLEHGWAYGAAGNALQGKLFLSVVTTGGRESAYSPEGHNRYTIAELLRPIEQTARLCGMTYLPPFVVHGTHGMTEAEMNSRAQEYTELLTLLREGRVDLDRARVLPRINANLEQIVAKRQGR